MMHDGSTDSEDTFMKPSERSGEEEKGFGEVSSSSFSYALRNTALNAIATGRKDAKNKKTKRKSMFFRGEGGCGANTRSKFVK